MAGVLTMGELNSCFSEKLPHVQGLDTVRAMAALSVVFAHILGPALPAMFVTLGIGKDIAELAKYIFTGHPAVIVFFVVSGFCIHYPYTRRDLPVVAFTVARWTRIMIPVLVAILFAKFLHVSGFNFQEGFILWSIVCELWYYSLYPFFLLLSRRISFNSQFIIAFLFSFVLVAYLGSDEYGRAHRYGPWLNWVVALPSWLLGCVLADYVSKGADIRRYGTRDVILWRVLVAAIASILYWLTMNTRFGYYLTMNAFAILACLWIYVEINTRKQVDSLLERTGKWSYSIYLFHMVLLGIVGKLTNLVLIKILIILWLCHKIYRHVEKPSHEYARRLFQRYKEQFPQLVIARH